MPIGLLDPIKEVLLSILKFFFRYTNDYGVAIILLTITVRIFILPLTIKQIKSMQEMKKLHPKLKELQEKYKDNKQKLQEEMMKFYAEHKVNPFSGCLPLLLQLPILFALFQMLIQNKSLKNEPFLFFIRDLTLSAASPRLVELGFVALLPYYLLIILMVLTTYIPQKMMSTDPGQDRIMLFMTLFMAYIAWQLPAGVLLYWVTTNVWTIVQQYFSIKTSEGGGNRG